MPKYTFIPESQIDTKTETKFYKASITEKGILYLGAHFVEDKELDGKYIQLYQLKTATQEGIGMRIMEGSTSLQVLDKCRLVKKNSSGSAFISVAKILRSFGRFGEKYTKLDIVHYAPQFGQNKGFEYWYIILNDKQNESKD